MYLSRYRDRYRYRLVCMHMPRYVRLIPRSGARSVQAGFSVQLDLPMLLSRPTLKRLVGALEVGAGNAGQMVF